MTTCACAHLKSPKGRGSQPKTSGRSVDGIARPGRYKSLPRLGWRLSPGGSRAPTVSDGTPDGPKPASEAAPLKGSAPKSTVGAGDRSRSPAKHVLSACLAGSRRGRGPGPARAGLGTARLQLPLMSANPQISLRLLDPGLRRGTVSCRHDCPALSPQLVCPAGARHCRARPKRRAPPPCRPGRTAWRGAAGPKCRRSSRYSR